MYSKLKVILFYIFNLFLYLIMFIIPKDKKIWLFGSWNGQRYADNSKYLFEYIQINNPDIKAIWIIKNKKKFQQLKDGKKNIYLAYSIFGLWYSMRAKVLCITQTISSDLHYCNNHPYVYKVQLWHGAPLKKILNDSHFAKKFTKYQNKRKIINTIFPFYTEKYNLLTACSKEDKKNFSTAFQLAEEKIEILGYPRNDVLFEKISETEHKKIIYAPTLRRDNNNTVLDIFSIGEIDKINTKLANLNCKLYVKLHPLNTPNIYLLNSIKNTKNIILLDNEFDLQEELKNYDILMTDYSSIYFDFLLTDRPIIFVPFDYDNYLINDRTFYYEYNDVTPGPKAKNWEEALSWIIKFIDKPELYAEERKIIKDKFHTFQDSSSCERIVNYIKGRI